MSRLNISKFLSVTASLILLSSCANMQAMIDQQQQTKELSVAQTLQVSIPLPDNSNYLINKSVIIGEGNKFSGILYLQHEQSADDIVTFYRKSMISDGWSEIGIVRSNFILVNFEKEHRFATIKVTREMFEKSESEITIGPKSSSQLEKSLDTNSGNISDEPFVIE
ncbi:hypothetical protein OAR47_02200 [Gammaproteobacteria bacterium]|nr:hypothetical protein [Gammaproteobacteria bacterium]